MGRETATRSSSVSLAPCVNRLVNGKSMPHGCSSALRGTAHRRLVQTMLEADAANHSRHSSTWIEAPLWSACQPSSRRSSDGKLGGEGCRQFWETTQRN